MTWVPRTGTTAMHSCEMPPLAAWAQTGMDWRCGHCGKVWRTAASQMMPLYGPTGAITNIAVPVWEEVKPIPIPFTTTAAADAFLDGGR